MKRTKSVWNDAKVYSMLLKSVNGFSFCCDFCIFWNRNVLVWFKQVIWISVELRPSSSSFKSAECGKPLICFAFVWVMPSVVLRVLDVMPKCVPCCWRVWTTFTCYDFCIFFWVRNVLVWFKQCIWIKFSWDLPHLLSQQSVVNLWFVLLSFG